jgi:glycosyltransferase involved in cell wall biosynthesis
MRIHQMTAALAPGDAIGNHVLTLRRIFAEMGYTGDIYADHVHPALGHAWRHSSEYRPTGRDVFWFHYSIGADNFRCLEDNPDRLVMDFHGITPPHLMDGDLRRRAEQALAALPGYADHFHLCVVHSDYAADGLRQHGYPHIEKLPLVVDTSRFDGGEDETLSCLLAKLEYILFVGRIVPQKGLLDLLRTFAHLKRLRPDMRLLLVGETGVIPDYTRQVERLSGDLGLASDVLMTGPVVAPDMLTSLYRHAAVTVLLSEWESFCVPVVESLFFGTPVVCNDLPPLREAAGGGGVLVQRVRHAETAEGIHALLEDRARYARLQAAGRAWARGFTPAALDARIRALLPRIVG